LFEWRENLELARDLANGAPGTSVLVPISEATARCVVGRAYYAAFGHARVYAIRNLGFVSTGTAADHGRLAQHFRMQGMGSVALGLRDLRRWRNECDYDDTVATLTTYVIDALRESAAVIRRL
jgi:hypothetical protein